ncbi:MAG TPA: aminotransferase class IV, partial [Stellaceae bacterium]|nr:aminotransferase class IV [Stellaceae bacterium]
NVLGKQQAREAGAYEAWFVDRDGNVTEGSSTNAWIVTRDGELVTRQLGSAILGGVTRRSLIRLAGESQIKVVERPFTLDEARQAREAFLTSTTSDLMPVTSIDGQPVANGAPGLLTQRLRADYLAHVASFATPAGAGSSG